MDGRVLGDGELGVVPVTEMPHACLNMKIVVDGPEYPFNYNDIFCEYSTSIFDGGTSVLTFKYCPFCGEQLPESKRGEYFDVLEKLGIEAYLPDPEVPAEMHTGTWWRKSISHETI